MSCCFIKIYWLLFPWAVDCQQVNCTGEAHTKVYGWINKEELPQAVFEQLNDEGQPRANECALNTYRELKEGWLLLATL